MKGFNRTDLGNAERFVARHGDDVRWVPAWNRFLIWDDKRWAVDETLEVYRRAKDTVRAMWDEVKTLDDDEQKGLVAHVLASEKNARILAMLERVKAEPGIAIRPAELDADPWLLCVANGTIDLRTGKLRDHARADLITKLVPASFDPAAGARCDRWEKFLHRVLAGDVELIEFVQRAVGYSLTGLTTARALFFLHGFGANGKSTFLEIIRHLMAGYASQADFTAFLEKKGDGPRNDIARLFGARVVTSSEVGENKRFNESLVKALTGNEVVSARFLYAESFEFTPTFKLWLAANHRPVIRGTDNAIWDRVKLIPFMVAIPVEERDPDLRDRLLEELDGILTWAVAGVLMWQREGLGSPAAVRLATDEYRKDSDTLGAFLDDCCELGSSDLHAEPATKLYRTYVAWCKEGGEFALTQTKFGRALTERGILSTEKGRDKGRLKWRVGLRIVHEPESLHLHAASAPADLSREHEDAPEYATHGAEHAQAGLAL